VAARKGIRAKVLARLLEGPMTGRQIEAMYIELGGAVDERGRVSFDTMRHLLNGLPIRSSDWDHKKCRKQQGRSRLLDRTYSIHEENYRKQEEERLRPQRAKELLKSLLR
jgi:hypothetical protein